MGVLNVILEAVFDVLFAPFRSLGPWPGMIFISLATGILMLLIFKKTSNQEGIKRAKNQIKASNGTQGGDNLATIGIVLGAVGIVLNILWRVWFFN